jgi:hypothetical protein
MSGITASGRVTGVGFANYVVGNEVIMHAPSLALHSKLDGSRYDAILGGQATQLATPAPVDATFHLATCPSTALHARYISYLRFLISI